MRSNSWDSVRYCRVFRTVCKAPGFSGIARSNPRCARTSKSAPEPTGRISVREAVHRKYSVGDPPGSRRLTLSNDRAVSGISAMALGLGGETSEATRIGDDLSKKYTEDTMMQFGLVAHDSRFGLPPRQEGRPGDRRFVSRSAFRVRRSYPGFRSVAPSTCAAWPTCNSNKAHKRSLNSKKSSTIRASPPTRS